MIIWHTLKKLGINYEQPFDPVNNIQICQV